MINTGPAPHAARPSGERVTGGSGDATSRGALHEMAEPAGAAQRPGVQTTPCGMEVTDFILHDMVAALERSSDYPARHRAVAEWNKGHTGIKRGLADAGEIRHLLHAHASEPGRGARPHLP